MRQIGLFGIIFISSGKLLNALNGLNQLILNPVKGVYRIISRVLDWKTFLSGVIKVFCFFLGPLYFNNILEVIDVVVYTENGLQIKAVGVGVIHFFHKCENVHLRILILVCCVIKFCILFFVNSKIFLARALVLVSFRRNFAPSTLTDKFFDGIINLSQLQVGNCYGEGHFERNRIIVVDDVLGVLCM